MEKKGETRGRKALVIIFSHGRRYVSKLLDLDMTMFPIYGITGIRNVSFNATADKQLFFALVGKKHKKEGKKAWNKFLDSLKIK